MAAKTKYEKRSTLEALQTFLEGRGWAGVSYRDGYAGENPIVPPEVSVTIPPHSPKQLQLGRVQGQESLYARTITINAYMKNERQADDIVDDIIDFMEFECIAIQDHEDNVLGTLQCVDPDGIVGETFPPIMGSPQNLRWRGVVSGPYESFYPNQ